jgi:hypothetical protein
MGCAVKNWSADRPRPLRGSVGETMNVTEKLPGGRAPALTRRFVPPSPFSLREKGRG